MQVDAAKEDQPDMSAVLEKCLSKKEMRKRGKGIVRFQGSEVDMREVSCGCPKMALRVR